MSPSRCQDGPAADRPPDWAWDLAQPSHKDWIRFVEQGPARFREMQDFGFRCVGHRDPQLSTHAVVRDSPVVWNMSTLWTICVRENSPCCHPHSIVSSHASMRNVFSARLCSSSGSVAASPSTTIVHGGLTAYPAHPLMMTARITSWVWQSAGISGRSASLRWILPQSGFHGGLVLRVSLRSDAAMIVALGFISSAAACSSMVECGLAMSSLSLRSPTFSVGAWYLVDKPRVFRYRAPRLEACQPGSLRVSGPERNARFLTGGFSRSSAVPVCRRFPRRALD